MNVTDLMNKITGKTLTRADLDQDKLNKGTFYLVVAFPYIDSEMLMKIQSWLVANKYKNVNEWHIDPGQFGDQAILSMTVEVIE